MSLSMYQASIPVFAHALTALSGVLDKAEAHATSKKIDPAVLLATRLTPDMFPLSRQVQITCDMAKGGAARLAGVDNPSFPDTEKTFAELRQRIAATLAFVNAQPAAAIDGSEERAITIKAGERELHFKGQNYLLQFVLPNLFFHASTTYAILRANGVELGKGDYLGMTRPA